MRWLPKKTDLVSRARDVALHLSTRVRGTVLYSVLESHFKRDLGKLKFQRKLNSFGSESHDIKGMI